ncbi:MAG: D-alanine--D-alanine ligase [Fuerstia sp.]|nr:D-alanine--D-alanine ligase [Fuerstiella sp.]
MTPIVSQFGSLRIVVLAGGTSAEREVSLESGACVAAALKQRGHLVLQCDPAILALHEIPRRTDVILPMLHGTGGEDGALQQNLERLGIPWLGSSAEASALTFDKVATRDVLANAGLPVAPGLALPVDASGESIKAASRAIGYPQVVKPAAQGSSVGITIVDAEQEIEAAVSEAARWGTVFLIEKYIAGREITVPVVNGEAFPAVEILPSVRWYDYSAKYTDETTRYDVAPKNLPANLNEIVLAACKSCGVTGISRTDLRVDSAGQPWILEINTIPGMTTHSLVPMSARARGISIGELCEQLLLRAIDRSRILPMTRGGQILPRSTVDGQGWNHG